MNMKLQEIIKMLQDETQLHIDTMKKIEQELINQEESMKNVDWDISTNSIIADSIIGDSITIKENDEIVLTINQDGITTSSKVKELKEEEDETDKFINFLLDLEKRITKLENNNLDNDMKNISNKVGENIFNSLKRMDVNIR